MVNIKLVDRELQDQYYKPVAVTFSKYLSPHAGVGDEVSQVPFEIIWHIEDQCAYMYVQTMFNVIASGLGLPLSHSIGYSTFQLEGQFNPLDLKDTPFERDTYTTPPTEDDGVDYVEESDYDAYEDDAYR